jgi:hypothetical protein
MLQKPQNTLLTYSCTIHNRKPQNTLLTPPPNITENQEQHAVSLRYEYKNFTPSSITFYNSTFKIYVGFQAFKITLYLTHHMQQKPLTPSIAEG